MPMDYEATRTYTTDELATFFRNIADEVEKRGIVSKSLRLEINYDLIECLPKGTWKEFRRGPRRRVHVEWEFSDIPGPIEALGERRPND